MSTIIPAGTWVAIVPARVDWARAGMAARIYYLTEPQQLAALLRPDTATLLRGVHQYPSTRTAVDRGPTGPAIEVEETGDIVWNGREPRSEAPVRPVPESLTGP